MSIEMNNNIFLVHTWHWLRSLSI